MRLVMQTLPSCLPARIDRIASSCSVPLTSHPSPHPLPKRTVCLPALEPSRSQRSHSAVQPQASSAPPPPLLSTHPAAMLSALLRVGGIGDGLFVIFFFLGLSVLICAVGLRTDRPSLFCIAAVLLSLFIILFMVLVPKAPPGGEVDLEVYDHTSGFRMAAVVILGISAFITALMVCAQVVMVPIQGSRIRNN